MQLKETINTIKFDRIDGAASAPASSDRQDSAKSTELQLLADRVRYVNPSMAEMLNNAANLISDTPWLFWDKG